MGDGTVALILDVLGTAQRARVVSETRDRNLSKQIGNGADESTARQTLLILAVGEHRVALPISMVARLEEIPSAQIEWAGQREVVQYRGQILPLLRLSQALDIPSRLDPERPLQVVVYSENGRSVGLVVDRITDIVEATLSIERHALGEDLLGSVVIQDRVTDLLNLPAIIRGQDPSFFAPTPDAQGETIAS